MKYVYSECAVLCLWIGRSLAALFVWQNKSKERETSGREKKTCSTNNGIVDDRNAMPNRIRARKPHMQLTI